MSLSLTRCPGSTWIVVPVPTGPVMTVACCVSAAQAGLSTAIASAMAAATADRFMPLSLRHRRSASCSGRAAPEADLVAVRIAEDPLAHAVVVLLSLGRL